MLHPVEATGGRAAARGNERQPPGNNDKRAAASLMMRGERGQHAATTLQHGNNAAMQQHSNNAAAQQQHCNTATTEQQCSNTATMLQHSNNAATRQQQGNISLQNVIRTQFVARHLDSSHIHVFMCSCVHAVGSQSVWFHFSLFLLFVFSGIRTEQDLYVRLIDSMTKQVRRPANTPS